MSSHFGHEANKTVTKIWQQLTSPFRLGQKFSSLERGLAYPLIKNREIVVKPKSITSDLGISAREPANLEKLITKALEIAFSEDVTCEWREFIGWNGVPLLLCLGWTNQSSCSGGQCRRRRSAYREGDCHQK